MMNGINAVGNATGSTTVATWLEVLHAEFVTGTLNSSIATPETTSHSDGSQIGNQIVKLKSPFH